MTEEGPQYGAPIKEEMTVLDIKREYFEIVYNQLKENQQLPPGDVVPWEQYQRVVNYLRDKKVLDEDNKIQEKDMKIFDSKMRLEGMLEELSESSSLDSLPGSSGGMMPCRRSKPLTSGGISSCRGN